MLRLCQINDCRDIWQINQEELNYNVPFEVVEKQLLKILQDPNQQIYVYESDKRVVGYVHASKYDLLYAPPLITILGIAVLKEYQRNGIVELAVFSLMRELIVRLHINFMKLGAMNVARNSLIL